MLLPAQVFFFYALMPIINLATLRPHPSIRSNYLTAYKDEMFNRMQHMEGHKFSCLWLSTLYVFAQCMYYIMRQ